MRYSPRCVSHVLGSSQPCHCFNSVLRSRRILYTICKLSGSRIYTWINHSEYEPSSSPLYMVDFDAPSRKHCINSTKAASFYIEENLDSWYNSILNGEYKNQAALGLHKRQSAFLFRWSKQKLCMNMNHNCAVPRINTSIARSGNHIYLFVGNCALFFARIALCHDVGLFLTSNFFLIRTHHLFATLQCQFRRG